MFSKRLGDIFVPMTVTKFGGAVLSTPEGFRAMVDILRSSQPGLVVVSAFASTTRNLESAARAAAAGLEAETDQRLRDVMDVHTALIGSVAAADAGSLHSLLSEVEANLRTLLSGVAITRQLTPRTLDRILAYGELMALHIARHVVKGAGMDVVWCDATSVLVTTDEYGSASPLTEKSQVRVDKVLRPLLNDHHFVMLQGFVGATENGTVTTMGRESSNLTATFMASLLGADSVHIWTDVEGIRTGDPAIMSDTQHIPVLSYEQATIAAHHGVKLLFATMIEPAERAGIPIHISSIWNPTAGTTVIGREAGDPLPIVAIHDANGAELRNVDVIFVSPEEWLSALSSSITSVNDTDSFYVISDPNDHSVTISVDADDAPSLAIQIHSLLTASSAP